MPAGSQFATSTTFPKAARRLHTRLQSLPGGPVHTAPAFERLLRESGYDDADVALHGLAFFIERARSSPEPAMVFQLLDRYSIRQLNILNLQ